MIIVKIIMLVFIILVIISIIIHMKLILARMILVKMIIFMMNGENDPYDEDVYIILIMVRNSSDNKRFCRNP